jgi:AcrR family transcriptional regulator
MGKAIANKQLKFTSLMEAAFELFTEKGIGETSISDITSRSGVAKGTFYLYFKDKFDIRNKLIMYESSKVFKAAYEALQEVDIPDLSDKLIFFIDKILDQLIESPKLMSLISKNLSWATLKRELERPTLTDFFDLSEPFNKLTEECGISEHDSEIMLYLILEFVGSSCYYSILYNDPCPIEELKPRIYRTVRGIISDTINGASE